MGLASLLIDISRGGRTFQWRSVELGGGRVARDAIELGETRRLALEDPIGANILEHLEGNRPAKCQAFAAAGRGASATVGMGQAERRGPWRDLDEARQRDRIDDGLQVRKPFAQTPFDQITPRTTPLGLS